MSERQNDASKAYSRVDPQRGSRCNDGHSVILSLVELGVCFRQTRFGPTDQKVCAIFKASLAIGHFLSINYSDK